MRLVNIHTLKLEEFFDSDIPHYYILSHRWGTDETSFKQFMKNPDTNTDGCRKIAGACRFAKERRGDQGPNYIWIDTCCIDKRSSAELSEAINSMYKWYEKSRECLVYLADVPSSTETPQAVNKTFRSSSWFTRGWTLQELLAPFVIVFCDVDWNIIGHKCRGTSGCYFDPSRYGAHLEDTISQITRISKPSLRSVSLREETCIAEKMSWAARRKTTRAEDRAYCLLGIFDVNMPLLYGEGYKAFRRLQEELIKRSNDTSIFAWGLAMDHPYPELMLAGDPSWFAACGNARFARKVGLARPYAITNHGLEMDVDLYRAYHPAGHDYDKWEFHGALYSIELNCRQDSQSGRTHVRILLRNHNIQDDPRHVPDGTYLIRLWPPKGQSTINKMELKPVGRRKIYIQA